MPLSHVEPYFLRSQRALVAIVIKDDQNVISIGSGSLVELGGREFVLTAAHNLIEDGHCHQVGMGMVSDHITTLMHPGNGSVGNVHLPTTLVGQSPDPDVAVIELTPKTVLLQGRTPFRENEIAFFDASQVSDRQDDQVAGRELVVTGLPSQLVDPREGLDLGDGRGTRNALDVGTQSVRVWSIPTVTTRPRFPSEPAEDRGTHVYVSHSVEGEEGSVRRVAAPKGMSGGPLVDPAQEGALVGLVRGVMALGDGWDMWCEPAAEAVRLLLNHEDSTVAAAASRVVQRYDVARSRARSEGATFTN